VKQQIVEMTLNGVEYEILPGFYVSTSVMRELKKLTLKPVNQKLLSQLQPEQVEVIFEK